MQQEKFTLMSEVIDKYGHKEGWNEMYRNNVTPWNLKKASPSLVDIEGKIPKDAKCIVPGCGEGFDCVFLAESSPERVVYGIDLSDLVVAANLDRIKQLDSKVQERIKFLCIDFFNSQDHLQDASFDFLFDYTFLCAIHPDYRPDWVKTLSRLLKKGAMLATLMYPLNETRPLDDGPPFPLSPELYHELLDETFDLVSLEDVALDRSLPRRAGKEKMGIWRRK